MLCCPRDSRQLCIRKNPVQCFLHTFGTTLHRLKPYAILSERLQTILHKKKVCAICLNTLGITLHRSKSYVMLSEWLQTTLYKKKSCLLFPNTLGTTLSNVARKAPDNIARVKTLCNAVREAPNTIA